VASSANDLIINKQHGLLIVGFSFSFTFRYLCLALGGLTADHPVQPAAKFVQLLLGRSEIK